MNGESFPIDGEEFTLDGEGFTIDGRVFPIHREEFAIDREDLRSAFREARGISTVEVKWCHRIITRNFVWEIQDGESFHLPLKGQC